MAVKMFLGALGGPWFWFCFTFATVFECTVEMLQPWLLGLWATQYETHKPEDVNVPLYAYSRYFSVSCILTLAQVSWRIRRNGGNDAGCILHCSTRPFLGRLEGVPAVTQETYREGPRYNLAMVGQDAYVSYHHEVHARRFIW